MLANLWHHATGMRFVMTKFIQPDFMKIGNLELNNEKKPEEIKLKSD